MRVLRGRIPTGERHLLPRVKHHALRPLDMQVAEERLIPAGKWQPSHWRGHAHVDADHARVEVLLKLPCGPTARGEDGSPVAVAADVT